MGDRMMRNDCCKKALVIGIIVLFIVMSIIPSSGNVVVIDDNTPPVTTCTLDPPYPDGLNGWYVSDITVTLNATDDMSGVDFIKYLLDDNDWLTYTQPFKVYDGYHRITYYAVDKAGNVEQPSEVLRFKVDLTDPEIKRFVWEAYKENQKWYVKFTVKCSETLSGMDRVEFYMEEELWFTDYDEPYEWTLEWSEDYGNKV